MNETCVVCEGDGLVGDAPPEGETDRRSVCDNCGGTGQATTQPTIPIEEEVQVATGGAGGTAGTGPGDVAQAEAQAGQAGAEGQAAAEQPEQTAPHDGQDPVATPSA